MSSLRRNKSFWGLTTTQFLGAFNDSAFRQFIILLALSDAVKALVKEEFPAFGSDLQPVATIVFALPFVLFALLGGALADRFSKRVSHLSQVIFHLRRDRRMISPIHKAVAFQLF